MRRPPRTIISIVQPLAAFCLFTVTSVLFAEDRPGSEDHPELGRFEGSEIIGYDYKDFDAYVFATSPGKAGLDSGDVLEGEVRRISYLTPPGASILQVARNYRNQLESAGYEILFECKNKACGSSGFAYGLDLFRIPVMIIDPFDYEYLAARKTADGGTTHVTIAVSADNKAQIYSQVTAVVSGAMENRMVDAKAMEEGLFSEGHIALYGIYFDTDKAVVKPESAPTLVEISTLLSDSPDLQVILVGHTDNQGSLEYNRSLSERRAQAVVDTLVSEYGVNEARFSTAGVGYLAPVASNDNEDGRSLNRRVELVKFN